MSLEDGGVGDGDVVHPLLVAEVGGRRGGVQGMVVSSRRGCNAVVVAVTWQKKGGGGGAWVAAVFPSL